MEQDVGAVEKGRILESPDPACRNPHARFAESAGVEFSFGRDATALCAERPAHRTTLQAHRGRECMRRSARHAADRRSVPCSPPSAVRSTAGPSCAARRRGHGARRNTPMARMFATAQTAPRTNPSLTGSRLVGPWPTQGSLLTNSRQACVPAAWNDGRNVTPRARAPPRSMRTEELNALLPHPTDAARRCGLPRCCADGRPHAAVRRRPRPLVRPQKRSAMHWRRDRGTTGHRGMPQHRADRHAGRISLSRAHVETSGCDRPSPRTQPLRT